MCVAVDIDREENKKHEHPPQQHWVIIVIYWHSDVHLLDPGVFFVWYLEWSQARWGDKVSLGSMNQLNDITEVTDSNGKIISSSFAAL